MNTRSRPGKWVGLGALAMVVTVSSGCGQVSGMLQGSSGDSMPTTGGAVVSQPAVRATPAAVSAPGSAPANGKPAGTGSRAQQQAAAYRGTIQSTLAVDGVIAAGEEVPLTFASHGRVQDLRVKAGQTVETGDLLMQIDAAEIARQLSSAKARLQSSTANVAQAQSQALARQQSLAQRAAADQAQRQQAITEAESTVRRAHAELEQVRVGASVADRRSAQNLVDAARAVLDKARTDQARIGEGPTQADIDTAQRETANLRIAADRAQADLAALTAGPDPFQLRTAQRSLDAARTALKAAQDARSAPVVDVTQRAAREAAVTNADLQVQVAQDQLDRLQAPPKPIDIATAQQRASDAQAALETSQARLDALRDGPDQTALGHAQAATAAATRNLDDALARQQTVNSRPTVSELADAQDRVARAQSALDQLRNAPLSQPSDEGAIDLGALEKAVAQDNEMIAQLEHDLETTRLTAPFAGTVVSVRVRAGDDMTTSKVAVVLAKPGPRIVRLLLDDSTTAIAVGQKVSIKIDGVDKALAGSVASLGTLKSSSAAAPVPVAILSIDWGAVVPAYGMPVQVSVTVDQHENALLVPKGAVRTTAGRTFVEAVDGTSRRMLPVQVGIAGTDSIEILNGLSDGQPILLRP